MQDKIADNMLSLTRSLKEQSQLANKIIKKDTEVRKLNKYTSWFKKVDFMCVVCVKTKWLPRYRAL